MWQVYLSSLWSCANWSQYGYPKGPKSYRIPLTFPALFSEFIFLLPTRRFYLLVGRISNLNPHEIRSLWDGVISVQRHIFQRLFSINIFCLLFIPRRLTFLRKTSSNSDGNVAQLSSSRQVSVARLGPTTKEFLFSEAGSGHEKHFVSFQIWSF